MTGNGEGLGVFDALSYFDDSLTPGIEYTYTISAVGLDGELSDSSSVVLRTPQYADMIASLQRKVLSLENQLNSLEIQLIDGIRSPVPQTGQRVLMQPGDDGDLQAGVAWLAPDSRRTAMVRSRTS